jgi:polyisoprenyl-teichoic acid--peptidoglycan teichoic acid transferase
MSTPKFNRTGPPLFAVLTFWVFVVGGLVFAGVFMSNWRALAARTAQAPVGTSPPKLVTVGAGPVTVSVPVSISPAPMALPSKPADVSSSIVSVVKTVLPDWQGTERFNVLLLGIDKRDDEPAAGTRSDTMMIASIDPETKSVALISIPRDLWVTIPGCSAAAGCFGGQQRINFAHAIGGPDLTARTITGVFGLPIDYYARVDFRGFEDAVNAVGGVLIDVDTPVKDDEYPTYDYGYQRIYFAPGPQLLDGKSALQYARSRHGTNDFSRAARQQRVIVAIRNRALQLNMITRAPELAGIIQKNLYTNLSLPQMLSLAKLLSQVDRERIQPLVIDTNYVTPFTGADGAALLDPSVPRIRAAIAAVQKSAAHPELQAKIEVLNGTGTVGMEKKAADFLKSQGYNVVRSASADAGEYRFSQVQVLAQDHGAAEALAAALRVPHTAISDLPTPNAGADVRILLGQDFRLPPTS